MVISSLDRKLLRDLRRLKGQLFTICLVVACGIAAFVSLNGNVLALERARTTYYERNRFGDVFVHLERAPEARRADLEAIAGVARVETRVVEGALLPIAGLAMPVQALLVSLPATGRPGLCDIYLRDGRLPRPHHSDEGVLLQAFADVHGITPGDRMKAVINGTLREVQIVGIAMAPEYVIGIASGDMTGDPKRFAVLWMDRDALAAAFRMEGAFNDVVLGLQPGASSRAVLAAVDELLEPYGGLGAIPREKQMSEFTINGELMQLRSMTTVVPLIFLAVAALLLNIVLSRLVNLQRPEIATLKAVGYADWQVGLHFLKLVLLISALGAILGVALGAYMGGALLDLYREYFKFPDLTFRVDLRAALSAIGVSFAAAFVGAFGAVRNVMRLPPAEAMRPAAPAKYRRSIVDALGLARVVGAAVHMIVREIERRPLRTLGSALAIAASAGLTVIGGFYVDGIDALIYTQFHEVMREDLAVTFREPLPERAIRSLAHLPGVLHAEGMRVVPVRFRSGHRFRDGAIWGYPDDGELRALRDKYGVPAPLPPDGIVLTDMLAEILGVEVGDTVEVDIRDGERGTQKVVVAGLVDESFGLQGHMRLEALRRWLGEEPMVSMALLRVDPEEEATVDARLEQMPMVAGVGRRRDILELFREQSAGMILAFAGIITLFAATICVGVVYNNARVALSLRARDLASLRVLGFTRAEISAILLGEMAIQVLIALPLGMVFGYWMIQAMSSMMDPETYRLPFTVTARSYAFAVVVVLAASAVSALLVRRKLDRLDLIAVLKTRE